MKNQTTQEDFLKNVEFIKSTDIITIPKGLDKVVKKLDKDLLKKVNKKITIARELCLLFLSKLTHTLYSDNRYIEISAKDISKLLRKKGYSSTSVNGKLYQSILDVLLKGTEDGPIIDIDRQYIVADKERNIKGKSRGYAISDLYYGKGHKTYKLKTKYVKDIAYRNHLEQLAKVNVNTIAKNSLRFYATLDLPNKNELLEYGKKLCKDGYTNKGKVLTMRYRKDNSYWKDISKRTFVEDAIDRFNYYTENGFILPIIGSEETCPRVFDSFNVQNKWIRNVILSNNKELIETDIKCLHPNLIMNIFNGKLKNITHDEVAEYLGMDRDEVKTLHLSFFNLEVEDMKRSKLWDFYYNNDKELLDRVINDKINHGYKNTSRLGFILETEIMEKTIERLNAMNITVGYVFDALFATKDNIEIVNKTLNDVLKEMNIHTTAIIETEEINSNDISLTNTESETNSNTDISKENLDAQTETKTDIFFETRKYVIENLKEIFKMEHTYIKHKDNQRRIDNITNEIIEFKKNTKFTKKDFKEIVKSNFK